jgi:transketolase
MDRKEGFEMDGIGRSILLSNGHISQFYSVLARSGYFPVSELATFRFNQHEIARSLTTHDNLPGVRIASGSLGQGLSVAIGAAQAKKIKQRQPFSLHTSR